MNSTIIFISKAIKSFKLINFNLNLPFTESLEQAPPKITRCLPFSTSGNFRCFQYYEHPGSTLLKTFCIISQCLKQPS